MVFRYLTARLLSAVIVMFGVVTLVFLLIHLVPGDPVEVMLGESSTPADRETLRAALGLDRPLMVQWWHYVAGLMHGDLGVSLNGNEPVAGLLAQRILATAQLGLAALGLSLLIGLPLGMLAALRESGWGDWFALGFSTMAISMPSFWIGPLLILLFSIELGLLPVSGREAAGSLVLPALTLGLGMAAASTRMVGASLKTVLHEDYIRTARAKGLTEIRIVLRHALPNAALPVLTVIGLQLGGVLAGTVITETIFQWPGVGLLTIESIQRRDYPVVQGCVLLISLVYVLANTVTDMAYGWVDPRVRVL